MADGTFPTLVSKDRLSNALTNPIFVNLSDGVDGALIDASGNLQVILASNDGVDIGDVDVISVVPGVGATNLGKAEDAVHGDGDTGVMALAVRRDADTSLVGIDGDYAPLQVNALGALKVDVISSVSPGGLIDDSPYGIGTSDANPQGFLADETAPDSVDEGDIGIARMTLDRRQLNVITDGTTGSQRLAINASGQAQVDLAAHALTNANALPVSKDNAANSETNPIFVQPVTTGISGTEIHDFNQGVAVAADATSNHDVAVVGTTFFLKQVHFSSSGGIKVEVQTGSVASLATKAVGFIKRQGGVNVIEFTPPIEVPITGTGTIRVIRTNRQGAAMDVYTTIVGNDV